MLNRRVTAVAAAALLLTAAACTQPQEPAPTSPSTSAVASPSPSPEVSRPGARATYPGAAGQISEPPQSIGGLTRQSGTLSNGQIVYRGDEQQVMVVVMGGADVTDMAGRMTDPEEIGHWVCSDADPVSTTCITAAWQGVIMLFGSARTKAETAAFGDKLMAAWVG